MILTTPEPQQPNVVMYPPTADEEIIVISEDPMV